MKTTMSHLIEELSNYLDMPVKLRELVSNSVFESYIIGSVDKDTFDTDFYVDDIIKRLKQLPDSNNLDVQTFGSGFDSGEGGCSEYSVYYYEDDVIKTIEIIIIY